jgi:hypothetical protein
MILQHRFVEFIPEKVEEGVIYISIEYCTAIHKCVCGCGKEVVTPLSPTDWKLTFNGKAITLYPSIGNWNFECQSHYWIKNNRIVFAGRWTEREVHLGKESDVVRKREYFESLSADSLQERLISQDSSKLTILQKFLRFCRL